MATKSKTMVKLKPIDNRKDEKKPINTNIKKIPPVVAKNQQQSQQQKPKTTDFNRLIHGNFTEDFSKQTSRLFRIFLSSTFSDFKIERNEIYRRVFPIIRQKCAELGYEFQVVDMRWGVSDTADTDHTADILCMDEIERCIDLSAGLNFIYLIGNRYGYMYVPLEIDENEFQSIIEVAQETNIENHHLIQKWFQLDQNSLPPKYVYVPITTYFKHFEQSCAEQAQERAQWRIEEKSLLKALRDSVDKAFELKKLTHQQAIKYFQSITEREIRRGTAENNLSKVIGVIRDFSSPSVETAADAKFFDALKNERITKSINQLKSHCEKVTPATQLKKFVVPWKSGGLNPTAHKDHQDYINEFCEFLTSTILQLVETTCKKLSNKILSPFREDLLHHGIFCQEKTKSFFGREELLASIHSQIEANRRGTSTPIGLVAESGCGKTSFMARLAKELRVWYPQSAVAIRFLGTSARSITIELVLRSLCRQLKLLYGLVDDETADEDDSSLTFSSLVRLFHDRLKSISRQTSKTSRPKPFFILLDAIDQFDDPMKYSFQFDTWLLRFLPRDVHIILSFLPIVDQIPIKDLFLQFTRNDETCLFTVPRLRPKDSEDMIRSLLQASNRQLTSEQYAYLLSTVEQNPKPLYLKLLIDVVRRWTAYADVSLKSSLTLPETIENAIEQLFHRLENRHGKDFVQYSLAYLVYGYNGISENELEDCLSINDIVLNEIYTHHDPPIPQTIHVPSLLCQSFLYSIEEYLCRKRIHEKYILAFYHRKFIELTRKFARHLRQQCHEHLIEIYSHEKLDYQRTIQLKKRNNQIIENANRLINSQITNTLNQRKLIALPYHCLEYGHEKDDLLRSKCLFNLEFLSCQLQSLGHTTFLESIRYCLRLRPNWTDLKRVYRAVWSIDDESITDTDATRILAEQILGFIDTEEIRSIYASNDSMKNKSDLEKLLHDCQSYCQTHENSFRPLYAGFPQETGALAWSFSPTTHVLFTNDFYALVLIDGSQGEEDEELFMYAYTVALINLQTGKVDKIYLDEDFCYVWNGYVSKNGNKIYVFGKNQVRTYNTRTGDMISERSLSWDNKSFCNKDFCLTTNEERLIVANELRLIAMNEIDQNNIMRSGRIPVRNASFSIENSKDVIVKLRCIGANDEYVLCLIFDEYFHCLVTLWSLNEHDEMLPMRFAYLYLEVTSPYLFDFQMNSNNEILYMGTDEGYVRIIDLLKLKPNTKVQNLPNDEIAQKILVLQDKKFDALVCLTEDIIVLSTAEQLFLFNRNNFSEILQQLKFKEQLSDWKIVQEKNSNRRILLTVDTNCLFLTVYRQENSFQSKFTQMKIQFRSNIHFLKLLQTVTIMNDDEQLRTYVLIQLSDETIQLLDTNQISQQTSLQPNGLFTRIKNFHMSETSVIATEHDSNYPLQFSTSNEQNLLPRYVRAFDQMPIEHIALFDNDQFYIAINNDLLVSIYSVHDPSQNVFEYNLKTKSSTKFFAFRTYPLNIIIYMFYDKWIFMKMKFNRVENRFDVQSEQNFTIVNREIEYSIDFLPNQQYFLLKQSLKLENDPKLFDLRIYKCEQNFQISSIKDPIAYTKSKVSTIGKIIAFRTYTSFATRSELFVAHQGLILNVHLPSNQAALNIRSEYHSWLRHSLALYQNTTEKTSLSIQITSLALHPTDEAWLVSGADDGSMISWHFDGKSHHEIFESMHSDEITGLKFDPTTQRLFSSSSDRTLAVWSQTQLLHILRIHLPPSNIDLFSSNNILLVQGQFWGYERLLMFFVGKNSRLLSSVRKNELSNELKTTTSIQASDIASWAL